jgi:hypothetical protein
MARALRRQEKLRQDAAARARGIHSQEQKQKYYKITKGIPKEVDLRAFISSCFATGQTRQQ